MKKITLLTVAFLLWGATFAQKDKQLTSSTVSKAKIESHIYFLASDELLGRQTPSPEQRIAAKYLATQLKSYGVKPLPQYPDYYQPVAMKTVVTLPETSVQYKDKKFQYPDNALWLNGGNGSGEAEAIYLNFGSATDFSQTDVKGKVVVTKAGRENDTNPRSWQEASLEKRKLAAEKGAVALVELYANTQLPWKLLINYSKGGRTVTESQASTLPHLLLHDPEWKEATTATTQPMGRIRLSVKGLVENKFTVYNVVGYVEGTDQKLKEEYVTYSAHYDHIGVGRPNEKGDSIYNGARDNAVGSVTVLSAAENLAKYPTKRSALFILFTGEEKGLLGSSWFVENSPLDLKKIVYCFNSDNAGYNDVTRATIIGLGRTTADVYIKQACEAFGLKAEDDPAPEQNLFDRSDNVNFARKGIPAPTFSLGLTAFSGDVLKFYHQASDEPSSLDYDYLQKFFSSYVYACRLIGNAPVRPFWKSGDKYFDTGVKLYQ